MNFYEFEELMSAKGANSLADIARLLDTTPQAVSNWKARDQVPYHIVNKIRDFNSPEKRGKYKEQTSTPMIKDYNDDKIYLSDILITLSEQIKVVLITAFLIVFFSFTYVRFILTPVYVSSATILLPESKGSLGGLAGIASQFGVSVPTERVADLSSPSLYPEILLSRTFAEKILDKNFLSKKFNKKLPLFSILIDNSDSLARKSEVLTEKAIKELTANILSIDDDPTTSFTKINISTPEPFLSKSLADTVIIELEKLNRFYKSRNVNDRITFIEQRIKTIKNELTLSELKLKDFNEQNRQISSPALQIELERLRRDFEVQEGLYLTLKQQLELAKIEEIQQSSVVQILDFPSVPQRPSNKNNFLTLIVSAVLGLGSGIFLAFVRSYLKNDNVAQRKKIRRSKHFFKKKINELFLDLRFSGLVSVCMILGLPYYIFDSSTEPSYLNYYSTSSFFILIIYLPVLIIFSIISIYSIIKKRKSINRSLNVRK